MPRYDDRLKNILALIESDQNNKPDTVFRHICDILLQEGPWMDSAQRRQLIQYLAEYYPQASQAAKMEIADIASRVSEAPVELIALIGADDDVIGNRLWDGMRLSGEDWRFILPRLSKAALGRLRSRMDLSDENAVAVDREWRDRNRQPGYSIPSVEETVRFLATANIPLTVETTPPIAQDDPGPQTLFVPSEALQDEPLETVDPVEDDPAAAIDLSNFLNSPEHDADVPATDANPSDTRQAMEEPQDAAADEPDQVEETVVSLVDERDPTDSDESIIDLSTPADDDQTTTPTADEPLDLEAASHPQILELANRRATNSNDNTPDLPESEAPGDMVDGSDGPEVTPDSEDALEEEPQVDDPQIQDILQRLKEFGSRSRATPDQDTAQPPSDITDIAEEPIVTGPDTDADADEAAVPIFVPDGDDGPSTQTESTKTYEPAVSAIGVRWVTDRFGSIVDIEPQDAILFGSDADELVGDILSSAFVMASRQKLDRALSTRRGFRDLQVLSNADNAGWSLSAVPVFEPESGIFLGFRGTAISDPDFATRALQAQKASALDAAQSSKPQFDVSSLAHELKTPLNAIRGFAEMIELQQLGETSPFAQHRSRNISKQAQRLSNVLDDLLMNAVATGGGDESDEILSPALDALSDAVRGFDGEALLVDNLSQLPPGLATPLEPKFLTRIVHRFIHYAAQWTPVGRPVHVTVEVQDDGEENDTSLTLRARIPGWTGGADDSDLLPVSQGPRLPFGHPLANKALEGRALPSVLSDLDVVGAALALTADPGRPVMLSLRLPAKVAAIA